MNTKHTPLPWVFAYGSIYTGDFTPEKGATRIAGMDRDEPRTTPTERDANAQFIVKAVNCHEDLLMACHEALECIREWEKAGLICSTRKTRNIEAILTITIRKATGKTP